MPDACRRRGRINAVPRRTYAAAYASAPRANAAETPPQNPPSLRTAAARTAAAPARQTRHSRRFKSTRRDQRHDTIPSESRRALFHRFSPARRRYAGRLRGYAAHPLRSGGLRAVPRRRVGRRGGGARALFPAGADGHALRPTAAEAVRGKRRETPAALSAVRRSLLGGDGRLRAALPAAAVRLAVRGTARPAAGPRPLPRAAAAAAVPPSASRAAVGVSGVRQDERIARALRGAQSLSGRADPHCAWLRAGRNRRRAAGTAVLRRMAGAVHNTHAGRAGGAAAAAGRAAPAAARLPAAARVEEAAELLEKAQSRLRRKGVRPLGNPPSLRVAALSAGGRCKWTAGAIPASWSAPDDAARR